MYKKNILENFELIIIDLGVYLKHGYYGLDKF